MTKPFNSQNRLRIVVWAFSGYEDALRVFFLQVKKHLLLNEEIARRVEVFVWADRRGFVDRAIAPVVAAYPHINFKLLQYKEKWPFWRKIVSLFGLNPLKPVLILQDDFFLYEDVDFQRLLSLQERFRGERRESQFMRLVPSGIENPNPSTKLIEGESFLEVNSKTRYLFSWQASFWKPWVFALIHLIVRPESIREENSPKYRWVMRRLKMWGLATREWQLKYVLTAIRLGKWDFATPHGGDKLVTILMENSVDPAKRGFHPRRADGDK